MIKRFAFSVVALFCTMMTGAQNNDVVSAVLQTGDETKMYMGVEALIKAYNDAAETGSVITLSGGSFNSPGNIKKSVSIYGNCFEANTINNTQATTINGDILFSTGNDETSLENIRLEGFHLTGNILVNQIKNLIIDKCEFSTLRINGNYAEEISVRRCYLNGLNSLSSDYKIVGLDFQNCFITGRITHGNEENQILVDHCILAHYGDYGHEKALYRNCIIRLGGWRSDIAAGATIKNNIFSVGSVSASIQEGNWFSVSNDNIFDPEDGTDFSYSAERTFKLKTPNDFVGTDNTEVGINGGNYPWNKIPRMPVVKSLKLDVEGKQLNVTYEAEVR